MFNSLPTHIKTPSFIQSWAWRSCILFFSLPLYYSTDLAVHRNWTAITWTLPIKDWYFESTSIWTLDYPPFFAYFSWFVGYIASLVGFSDDSSLFAIYQDSNPELPSNQVYFMRFTVIAADLLFIYSIHKLFKPQTVVQRFIRACLVLFPPLLLVDHIHFQYNAFLFGILGLSLYHLFKENYFISGLLFSTLLCFKHLFLVIAPCYFVYFLSSYIFGYETGNNQLKRSKLNTPNKSPKPIPILKSIERFATIGLSVCIPFFAAFAPLYYSGGIENVFQCFNRMFPFQRGIVHRYWAPNFWAEYVFVDKILCRIMRNECPHGSLYVQGIGDLGFIPNSDTDQSIAKFDVLYDMSPRISMILIILSLIPILVRLNQKPNFKTFLWACICSSLVFFIFGWHVHEKAILTPLLFIAYLCFHQQLRPSFFVFYTVLCLFTVSPLLFSPESYLIRISFLLLFLSFGLHYVNPTINLQDAIFFFGIFVLTTFEIFSVFDTVTWPLVGWPSLYYQFPFLPLMARSLIGSVFVWYTFIHVYFSFGSIQ